jgi:hypothetical protein
MLVEAPALQTYLLFADLEPSLEEQDESDLDCALLEVLPPD